MKNYILKHFFWILVLAIAVSCSKNDPAPEPDAGSTVAGEYKVTEITASGQTVTEAMIDQLKGVATITLTRKEANKANFRFYVNLAGQVDDQEYEILLEKSGNVIFLKNIRTLQKAGQYQDGKIELTGTDPNGDTFLIKAKRK